MKTKLAVAFTLVSLVPVIALASSLRAQAPTVAWKASSVPQFSAESLAKAQRDSFPPIIELPEMVIVGQRPQKETTTTSKKQHTCSPWRDLVQGSGQVQACDYAK